MTPEAQRIAIAEACGYSDFGLQPVNLAFDRRVMWCEKAQKHIPIPDYLSDLNAMHEAEKVLTDEQRVDFRIRLMINSDGPKAEFRTVEAALCHATATQRAEAFLRALGKWAE